MRARPRTTSSPAVEGNQHGDDPRADLETGCRRTVLTGGAGDHEDREGDHQRRQPGRGPEARVVAATVVACDPVQPEVAPVLVAGGGVRASVLAPGAQAEADEAQVPACGEDAG